MTKAEEFDKATKLAMKGDLTMYDEIVHSDYESMNQQIPVNKEMSKSILSGIGDLITVGPMQKSMKARNSFVFIATQELPMQMFSIQ